MFRSWNIFQTYFHHSLSREGDKKLNESTHDSPDVCGWQFPFQAQASCKDWRTLWTKITPHYQHPHYQACSLHNYRVFPGEGLKVIVNIENNSSRAVKPKFCFYQKQSFFASKKRKVVTKDLLKEVGDPVEPSTKTSVTRVLKIPTDVCVSILNCRVLKVEYRLKVS